MSGTNNKQTFRNGVRAQLEKRYDVIQERAIGYCDVVVNHAIRSRESSPGKHDFTGNFLNSIVAVLYRDGKPVYVSYAFDYVRGAVRPKMNIGHGVYRFNPDYEDVPSAYEPEVPTDEGLGRNDAIAFASSYKPQRKSKFSIVCAYTTEYSNFVEFARHTSGVMRAYEWVAREARTFIGGPKIIN